MTLGRQGCDGFSCGIRMSWMNGQVEDTVGRCRMSEWPVVEEGSQPRAIAIDCHGLAHTAMSFTGPTDAINKHSILMPFLPALLLFQCSSSDGPCPLPGSRNPSALLSLCFPTVVSILGWPMTMATGQNHKRLQQ